MPGDLSRETTGDATEGLPWQIIYAAFLGVGVCAMGILGAAYLLHSASGRWGVAVGVAALVAALGVGTAFVALLAGASWALMTCRAFMSAASVLAAAGLVWGTIAAARATDWNVPPMDLWRSALEMLFQPRFLVPTAAAGLCAVMLWFLFGRTSKRFFSR